MAEAILQQQETDRRGEALALLALLLLSRVTQDDLVLAGATWERFAPSGMRRLIYARTVGNLSATSSAFPSLRTPPSPYRWNADLYRYVGPGGMTVRPRELKQAVNSFIRAAQADSANVTQRMNAGDIAISEWQEYMARHAKSVHLAADVVGQGGLRQVDQLDVKRMEAAVELQMEALRVFAGDVETLRIGDGAAVARAKLYDASANPTFEASVYDSYRRLAATGVRVQMRNRWFDGAEHCATSIKKGAVGCREEQRRGWATLGTMSLPGRRSCSFSCKCFIQYRIVK